MEKNDLLHYLPPILSRIKELEAICLSEDLEFDAARNAFISLCTNLFITLASEDGISRFERELGITPSENEALEVRRSRLITLKMSNSVYTLNWLALWLRSAEIEILPILNDYTLKVVLPSESDYSSLFDALITFIPANIELIQGIKMRNAEMDLFVGATVRTAIKKTFAGEPALLPNILADESGVIIGDENGKIIVF